MATHHPAPTTTHTTLVAVTISFLLGVSGCSRKDQIAKEAPPPPVRIAQVVKKDMPTRIHAIGTVESLKTVIITAQVGGVLTDVMFKEGELVSQGAHLFTIDQRPFTAALHEAQANLERERAKARLAEANVRRYQALAQKEFVSKEQFESARAESLSLWASVKAQEAALETAKLNLGYTEIRSPLAGRTGELRVKVGNVIRANDAATPLVTVHQMSPIAVKFAVPESALNEIRAEHSQAPLNVNVDTQGDRTPAKRGALFFIDNQVERQSGTVLLKAQFDNTDETLWPGQFVDVGLELNVRAGALVAPSQAIQVGQQGSYVFVVDSSGVAGLRTVKTGIVTEGNTEIIEGLQEGERVVIDGHLKVKSGAKVEIQS
jgi:multidrug efflux system membrane fusion protein